MAQKTDYTGVWLFIIGAIILFIIAKIMGKW